VVIMDAAKHVTATFTLNTYAVDVTADIENGSVIVEVVGGVQAAEVQATYPYGTVLRLTAAPDQGYVFASWVGDLVSFGTQNPIEITVDGPLAIDATFVVQEPAEHSVFLPAVTLNR